MSLLKPQPYLRGDVRLRKIFGVGPMTAARLQTRGFIKVKDLKTWLRATRRGPSQARAGHRGPGTQAQKKPE